MVYDCICDELPYPRPKSFIKPTGSFKEYLCTCRAPKSPGRRSLYWAEYNGVQALTCAVCNKLRRTIKKCRVCNEPFIYIGAPTLCNHYPAICRDCLRRGTYLPRNPFSYGDVLSTAQSERGLYYKPASYSSLSIDDLLEGL